MRRMLSAIRRVRQPLVLALIASMGTTDALRAQVREPPFDARLLLEIPKQKPGTVQLIPLAELPAPLRESFSLEATQRKAGMAKRGTAQYFVSAATPESLGLFDRLDRSLVADRSALRELFNGAVVDIALNPDTQGLAWRGFAKEGPLTDGKSNRVYQVFRSQSGEMYALLQWNFVASGAAILAAKENINATIDGQPGTMVVQVDEAGQTRWNLAWHSGDYWFELFVGGLPVSRESAAKILRIASSFR